MSSPEVIKISPSITSSFNDINFALRNLLSPVPDITILLSVLAFTAKSACPGSVIKVATEKSLLTSDTCPRIPKLSITI